LKSARVAKKYLKDNKHNSLYLARKYAQIFVLGHYLFLLLHFIGAEKQQPEIRTSAFTG